MTEKLGWILRSLDKHLARDVEAIDVRGVSAITDCFVFATGGSTTQVKALSDYVEKELSEHGVMPQRVEGYHNNARWILMDYGDVILHIFLQEARDFYDLERLWQDGTAVNIADFMETEEI